jgi:hypothetical protein
MDVTLGPDERGRDAPNASDEDAAVQGRSQLVADQFEHTIDVSLNLRGVVSGKRPLNVNEVEKRLLIQ